MKICSKCGDTKKLTEFYKNGSTLHSWCKTCNKENTITRQRNLKKKCVEYLGGKCASCKGVYHPAVYDFHHKDPDKKDFSLSKRSTTNFQNIVKELDKCLLLCSNCHRIEHASY